MYNVTFALHVGLVCTRHTDLSGYLFGKFGINKIFNKLTIYIYQVRRYFLLLLFLLSMKIFIIRIRNSEMKLVETRELVYYHPGSTQVCILGLKFVSLGLIFRNKDFQESIFCSYCALQLY